MHGETAAGFPFSLPPSGSLSVKISAGPHEPEKITALSGFAEGCTLGTAYQFAVFDFQRFVTPFLKLKERERNLADGSFLLQIEGGSGFRLAVEHGAASITETTGMGNADLSLNNLDALRFLFSPMAALVFPVIGKSVFLQSLLPLPLFYESVDGI